MGQQQLLLIVLGVIIVGIAIVVGINLFQAQAEESAKDSMIAAATNIGAMAQQYYKKPVTMGGGGGDFAPSAAGSTPFTIPVSLREDANGDYGIGASGTFVASAGDEVTIVGTPADETYEWTVECVVNMLAVPPAPQIISTVVE